MLGRLKNFLAAGDGGMKSNSTGIAALSARDKTVRCCGHVGKTYSQTSLPTFRAGQAQMRVAQITNQPRIGSRYRRLDSREADRRADRRILPGRETALRRGGTKRLWEESPPTRRKRVKGFRSERLASCESP